MPVSLLLRRKFEDFDDVVIRISRKLFLEFGHTVLRVDSFDDGPAIRVVVKEKN